MHTENGDKKRNGAIVRPRVIDARTSVTKTHSRPGRIHCVTLALSLWSTALSGAGLPCELHPIAVSVETLAGKVPGDQWQRMATVRALLGMMWAFPGKQLLFQGSERGDEAPTPTNSTSGRTPTVPSIRRTTEL